MGEVGDANKTGRSCPMLAAMFYRAVIQVVLIFGAETWLILTAM